VELPTEERNDLELESVTVKGADYSRQITITLPGSLLSAIEDFADSKGRNRSQVVKQAIEEFLKKGENSLFSEICDRLNHIETLLQPATKKEIDRTKDVEELLNDCTNPSTWDEEETSFELEGPGGFFAQVQERNLIGSIWTEPLLTKYAGMLKLGHDGYAFPPSYDDLIERSAEAMQLNKEQRVFLQQKISELEGSESESAEEEEE